MRLIIVGNGFDRVHDYKTSFSDFKAWIESQTNDLMDETGDIEHLLPEFFCGHHGEEIPANNKEVLLFMRLLFEANPQLDQERWCNFEDSLAYIDLIPVIKRFRGLIDGASIDSRGELRLSWEEDLYVDVAMRIRKSIGFLKVAFADWINSIDFSGEKRPALFTSLFSDEDIFLTFNYTSTLERLYGIEEERVCHIHGCVNRDPLCVGYGRGSKTLEEIMGADRIVAGSIIPAEATSFLRQSIEMLRKNTTENMKKSEGFFRTIITGIIREVISFGFSYGKADFEYIKKIADILNRVDKQAWYIYDRTDEETKQIICRIKEIGFKGRIETYHQTADIQSYN